MKEYTFVAYSRSGKWDSGESYVSVELTDEEAARLEAHGSNEIYYPIFETCEDLKDLYDRIYRIAVDQMTEEVRDFAEEETIKELGADDPNWKIDDSYQCGVLFPLEFEDMIFEDEDY